MSDCLELARVETQRQVVTTDQIKTWCANPDAQVVVKPVIDLNEHIHVEGYEVPARLREQTQLRDHTCVFPGAPGQRARLMPTMSSRTPRAAPRAVTTSRHCAGATTG